MTARQKKEPAAERLAALLQLQHLSRQCDRFSSFAFLIVNETIRLLPYDRAVFWTVDDGRVHIKAVSGVAAVEKNTPFTLWMEKAVGALLKADKKNEGRIVNAADVPEGLRGEWNEFSSETALWIPFIHPVSHDVTAGLWLMRVKPFSSAEAKAITLLSETYADVCALWMQAKKRKISKAGRYAKTKYVVAAAALCSLLPIRLSVLAPAEIIAAEPRYVTAPMNGVIEKFDVKPGEYVKAGTSLFHFENTVLRNQMNIAEKAASTAAAEYHKTAQSAFASSQNKARLPLIKLQIERARDELLHTRELLSRSDVKAPVDGVAVFSDANDWTGRPVVVGERILMLADNTKTALKIDVPVTDAIELSKGQPVKFFMHGQPTKPLQAEVSSVAFEPELTPERFLAYRVKAGLKNSEKPLRIGTRGIAKIYGSRVPVLYYVLRRPLAVCRQWLGV